jgi:uncharacterized protein
MTVSMLLAILEIPDLESIKDKRKIIISLRDRLIRKYKVSAAEVDLHDSLSFAQIGVAVVSNDRRHGEQVIQKVLGFIEDQLPGRVQEVQTHTEVYE